jgi:hypothetical protein
MATRKSATAADVPRKTTKRTRKSSAKRAPRAGEARSYSSASPDQLVEMARMANMLTPEQAIELYKANAKMALDVINAAIDSTAKMRKLQFAGEETARELGRKTARSAAEAKDAQSLMSMSQETGREALEKSLAYWNEMFELIVEMQKRLFTLIQDQAEGMPGFRHAKAAMAMMPDVSSMKNVINAMQGMVGSGSGAFASMQKMMADMTKMAQSAMPGMKR